jgi:hypothetical protein
MIEKGLMPIPLFENRTFYFENRYKKKSKHRSFAEKSGDTFFCSNFRFGFSELGFVGFIGFGRIDFEGF